MSTILRALKKAEENRTREDKAGPGPAAGSPGTKYAVPRPLAAGVILIAAACAAVAGLRYARARGSAPALVARDTPQAAPVLPTPPPAAGAPQQPDHKPAPALKELSLSGILWDESRPLAIINGKTLGAGEEIDGATVIKINLAGVTVRRGNEELVLRVD